MSTITTKAELEKKIEKLKDECKVLFNQIVENGDVNAPLFKEKSDLYKAKKAQYIELEKDLAISEL